MLQQQHTVFVSPSQQPLIILGFDIFRYCTYRIHICIHQLTVDVVVLAHHCQISAGLMML